MAQRLRSISLGPFVVAAAHELHQYGRVLHSTSPGVRSEMWTAYGSNQCLNIQRLTKISLLPILKNSENFGENQENLAETFLTCERNRKSFTDNSLTFTENRPSNFRANNVKNRPNYPENRVLERKNRGK
jgi:hypothetical protein